MTSSTSEESSLLVRDRGAVRHLILNRPERKNALDRTLVQNLGGALREADTAAGVAVVVLSGAGGAFCSGADLRTMHGLEPSELAVRLEEFHELIRAIAELGVPVLAAVDGPAVGFGADLALASDLRLFTERAYLEESFAKIGLMPDGGGTLWLPQLVGYGRAFELLCLAERLSAEQCQTLGIANGVVPAAELDVRAQAWAERLANMPPLSLRRIKRSLRDGQAPLLAATLAREKQGQLELLASEDFAEGVSAFLQKRPAVFQGR